MSAASLLALLLCMVVPVMPPVFPSVDLWNHLAVVEAQRAALTGSGPLAEHYGVTWTLYPYGLAYLPWVWLRGFMSPLLLGGVATGLAHAGVVAAGAWVLRASGAPAGTWALLLAACFSMSTWYGFLPYAWALVPALGAVACVSRAMERGAGRDVVAGGCMLLLAWLGHVEAWAASGVVLGGTLVFHPDRRRRLGVLLLCSAPSLLLTAWWLAGHAGHGTGALSVVYGPPKDRFGAWHAYHLWTEGPLGILAPGVVTAGGLAAAAWVFARARGSATRMTNTERQALGLLAGAWLVHLGFPKAVEGGEVAAWGQFLRTGVFTTLAGAACITLLPARWTRAAVAAVSLLSAGMALQAHARAAELHALVAPLLAHLRDATEPGARAVVVGGDDRMETGTLHHLAHVSSLWVLHGAVTHQFFTVPGTRLLMPRPELLPAVASDLEGETCRWAGRVDHVLVQGEEGPWAARLEAGGFTATWRHGRWSHWKRTTAPPPCGS